MQSIFVNDSKVSEVVYSDIVLSMNQADRAEISNLISQSEARVKSRRWPEWLKESIVLVIILGGCGFVLHSYIPAQIGSQTSSMASDVSSLKTSVDTIQKDVSEVKKDIKDTLNNALNRALQALPHDRSGGTPKGQGTALQIGNETIQIANDLRIKLDSVILVDYGKRAISSSRIAELRQVAWTGARLAMAQRTFINSDFEPPLPVPTDKDWVAKFANLSPVRGIVLWRGPWVNLDQGATLHRIGAPDPNANAPAVPQYLLIEHASADIDSFVLRNIVFRDSHIMYKGGSLNMSETFFVRCTFEVPFTLDGHSFSEALLASVPVNFKSSSLGE